MRILFLTQLVPLPLDAGAKTRAYYVMRHLAGAGHQLHLVSFSRPGDRPLESVELDRWCGSVTRVALERSRQRDAWHLVRSLLAPTPFLIGRDRSRSFLRAIERLLADQRFDAVHADQLWMAPYALAARRMAPGRPPLLVLDQHNAVFRVTSRLAAGERSRLQSALLRLESRKLARYERQACDAFDAVVWVSSADRDAVYRDAVDLDAADRDPVDGAAVAACAARRAHVIPIAIDPDRVTPLPLGAERRRVTFLGGLHWPPNAEGVRWFMERVWPRVRREAPHARLTIIGRDGARSLGRRRPAGASADPAVEITGYLADPSSRLAETGAFIVPLTSGAGMRVKILDAWCLGLPVVSTRLGAEGIAATDGVDLLLADTAEAFADAVVRLLRDAELARRLAREGRRAVERRYDWRRAYAAWDAVYATSGEELRAVMPGEKAER